MTLRYKARMLFVILLIGAILLGLIGMAARSSKLQYEINSLNRQIREAERTAKNLDVQIKAASNITNLEERAIELGLVYPEYDRIVHLDSDVVGIEDFALALMETVYGGR
ncbi:MAG TPA: hypothetical protein PL035_05135 [Bacillota bacterium]|nr:hypothetical protein [Bacillota bacterium]HQC36443.1 hypothetical protein [Bacillota bacterium]